MCDRRNLALRELSLAENLISVIEGIATLSNLSVLDLSGNRIHYLSGLEGRFLL